METKEQSLARMFAHWKTPSLDISTRLKLRHLLQLKEESGLELHDHGIAWLVICNCTYKSGQCVVVSLASVHFGRELISLKFSRFQEFVAAAAPPRHRQGVSTTAPVRELLTERGKNILWWRSAAATRSSKMMPVTASR